MSEQELNEPDIDTQDVSDAPEPEAVEPSEPVIEREWSDEDEAEARAFGWKPPEEWKGHRPEGFIDDPRQYIERAMTFKPFRTLKERLDNAERDYGERLRKIEAMNQRALDMQRHQFQSKLESIQQQKVAAVDMADKEAYQRLDREEQATRQAMMQSMQPPQQPQTPQPDPWVLQYAETEQGAWVKDTTLRSVGASLIEANPQMKAVPAEQQIKWVEAELKRLYPHEFAKPETKPQRQVVDSGGLAGKGGGDAFAKLPKEARDVFHRYVKEGVVSDTKEARAEWAEEYNAA